jgi:hypothetical protein
LKIPLDAIIPEEKLTHYLLARRKKNDKSKFLSQAGFTQHNPEALMLAIRELLEATEATEDDSNEYGDFYRVEGSISGPSGRNLEVVTVWIKLRIDASFRFVTLKPRRKTE